LRDTDIFLEVPQTTQNLINTEMDKFNKEMESLKLPTRNTAGEEMFAKPLEIQESQGTEDFLQSQSAASTWGMVDINTGPLTNLGTLDLPAIPTHQQAFHQVAPSYCNSYNTNKRMAMTTPGGSNDSSTHHVSKKVVVDYWQPQEDDGDGATQMETQATITGRDDMVLDGAGKEVEQKNITTTTQLHNEQEMMLKMAGAFGIDLSGDDAQRNLEKFLSTPVTTLGSVLKLMTTFHTRITQVELKAHAMTVEVMLDIFGDKIVSMHKELTWLGKEHRTTQKQRASVQVVLSGWPYNCSPEERNGFIRWMCREVRGLKDLLREWYKYNVDNSPELITHVLQVPPTTLVFRRGQNVRYGAITILTFTNFDARQEFLNVFMGWQPHFEWSDQHRTSNKIRSAPASPDFQRQLEVPLRTVHKVLNTAPNTKGMQFITLWKSLTVMQPQVMSHYDEDHKACFRLEYTVHKNTGDVMAEMHITEELSNMMKLKYDTVTQKVVDDSLMAQTLWQSCWTNQVDGREKEMTDATVEANRSVAEEGAYTVGKHWSQEFTKYTNTLFPFKIKLVVYPNDMDIEFDHTEYEKKMKNVNKNAEERDKNTNKGTGNTGAGDWHGGTGQLGAQSQSSTGISPSGGAAPTPTTQEAMERKQRDDQESCYLEIRKQQALVAAGKKIEEEAEAWKQQALERAKQEADAFHGKAPPPQVNTAPQRPPGMRPMMPPPGNHQTWPTQAASAPAQTGVTTTEALEPATLQPTNTGALPEGHWHKKGNEEKSVAWKGYEAFSAPPSKDESMENKI